MEYIYINTRTVPPWRARIWAALQKLFGQKTEIVRISDSITQPDVHDGSIPSPDFDTLLQMLCVDSDSLKFNKRLRWIGDIEMNNGFINKYHQQSFEQAIEKLNQRNDVLIAAVYLLTADYRIWKQVRRHVEKDRICFGAFKPVGCTEIGYTVYCAAKDIYLGTKHFTLSDLADKKLITPHLFKTLCSAMAIKRYGIRVLDRAKEGTV